MTQPTLPATIGRYRPTALLGAGVMGAVFRAYDPTIDRMVAIKVVRTEALNPDTCAEFIERFRLEVQAAARCAHPAIVAIHDFIGNAANPAIVMELVEGVSLQRILQGGATRPASVAVILQQVLGGLGYAHGQGVTHRDIKPANIIVTAAGQAKIADFGIARLHEASLSQTSLTQASLTQPGSMLGTPSYMAPEQVDGADVDRRADLFAVGAILYEACTGRPPFAGRSVAETLARLSGPLPADLTVVAATASAFVPVLRTALAKTPGQRFQSADAFIAALQNVGAAIPGGASDATVVLGTGFSGTIPGAGKSWDAALLQKIERQLAQYLGPVARVTVARAASQAVDAGQLYALVADGLRSAADRSAFLRALGAPRIEPTMSKTQPGDVGTRSDLAPAGTLPRQETISPDAIAAAQTALAHFIGPIARVLVRDAAAQALSGKDFIDRLCAQVSKPTEMSALRRQLRAEVEPKLG